MTERKNPFRSVKPRVSEEDLVRHGERINSMFAELPVDQRYEVLGAIVESAYFEGALVVLEVAERMLHDINLPGSRVTGAITISRQSGELAEEARRQIEAEGGVLDETHAAIMVTGTSTRRNPRMADVIGLLVADAAEQALAQDKGGGNGGGG